MRRGWTLVVVGAVVLAGCEAPTRPEHRTRINRIEMSGALAASGVVDMKAVITYPSDDGGTVRLAAPTLGTVSNVRIDGSPRTSSGEGVDIDVQGAHPTLEWSVAGAAERYVDGAIVTLPLWTPLLNEDENDTRVPVSGTLQLPSPPLGKVRWHGASPANVVVDGATVRFDGQISTATATEFSFVLPADALSAAPLLAGASRVSSYESRQAAADASDAGLAGHIRDRKRNEDLIANAYWGAVALEIAIPFLITLLVILRTAGVRRRATKDVPHESSEPPSDLAPAVVSLLQAGGEDIGAAAMAATILDLAQRKAVTIEAIAGQRYTLKVSGVSTRPGEAALLAELRRAGDIVGPPLPVKREGDWWRALRGDVVAIARGAGLLRRRYPSGLFLTAVVALAITTVPLYARSPEALVGGVVVATILAAIPFIGGYVLTAAGHREWARWEAYCRHLQGGDFEDVPAPGIIVWEGALVYAAALGVATTAIGDLS